MARRKKMAIGPDGEFGRLIRQRRRAVEMGIVELAQQCGMDPGLLSRIERGERRPPAMPYLTLLASSLRIPLESQAFAEMLELADRERNPELHDMAVKMGRPRQWNPFAPPRGAQVVVCASLGELVAQATESAINGGAVEIRVKPRRGRLSVFRLRK